MKVGLERWLRLEVGISMSRNTWGRDRRHEAGGSVAFGGRAGSRTYQKRSVLLG